MRRRVALFAEILRDMNYYKQMHWQYTKTHSHTNVGIADSVGEYYSIVRNE